MNDFARQLQVAKNLLVDFVIILGDLPGTEPTSVVLNELKQVVDASGIKVYTVRGNHDEKPIYEPLYGNSNYYIDHKGHRFVGLDDQQHLDPAYTRQPQQVGITSAHPEQPITLWRHRVPTTDELAPLKMYPNIKLALGGHHHALINWGVSLNMRRLTLDDWHELYWYTVVDVNVDGTSSVIHYKLPR
jgi:hypothetical protein